MKILQIVYKLSSGGAERFSVDLCNSLVAQGHDVELCIIRDLGITNNAFYLQELSSQIRLHNLKIRPGFSLRYFFNIRSLIKKISPEIVHVHLDLFKYIFPLPLIDKKRIYFQTIHNDASSIRSKIERTLSGYLYKQGKVKAVTISQETTRSFRKQWNCAPFSEIMNGCADAPPTELFSNVKYEIENYKRKDSDLVFLHVGRFSKQKNQKLLIDSFNNLAKEYSDYVLLVIGAGFNTEEAKYLISSANSRIKFLGERKNVADYFSLSDAFCLTSIYEGMPISLIEAYCHGCVPICTPVGGIINVIEDGTDGFLSKKIDTQSYLNALRSYVNNQKKVSKEALRAKYANFLSMRRCSQDYIRAYSTALIKQHEREQA